MVRLRRFHGPAIVCAGLLLHSVNLGAQDAASPQAVSGMRSDAGPSVRVPGAATGQAGGVLRSSPGALPPDTRSVASPASGRPSGSSGSSAGLSIQQQYVLERVNHYRALAGVAPVQADAKLLTAAQSHSSYLNGTGMAGHYETDKSSRYYTGNSPFDRILAQRYEYVAAGEVVAREPSAHPTQAVDDLMTAIYHRFIILSSDFTQAGPGVVMQAHQGVDVLDVTVDFGAEMLPPPPAPTILTVFPADGHRSVPTDFDPAQEFPNPMPGHTLVGYPVSVQADSRFTLAVDSFELYEVAPGSPARALEAKLLTHALDAETPAHAAAVIPVSPLTPSTTYRVAFSGSVNGATVSRTWQFTTASAVPVTMTFASMKVLPGGVQHARLDGLDTEKGPYYLCYSPERLVRSLTHQTESEFSIATGTDCSPGSSCEVTVQATYHSACTAPFAVGTFTIAR